MKHNVAEKDKIKLKRERKLKVKSKSTPENLSLTLQMHPSVKQGQTVYMSKEIKIETQKEG